ncbi:MAG TPA: HAD family hydrolase [Bacillota bacterium]|nr:HAD family hydrolase [Bacillota bacterium]
MAVVKMVVTDLDGTLLRTDKTVSSYTIKTMEDVKSLGVKLVFATGRGNSTGHLVDHQLFDGRVHLNGANAFIGDRLVYDRTIPSPVFAPLLRELSGHGLNVVAEIDGVHFSNFDVGTMWQGLDYVVVNDFDDQMGSAGKLYALIDYPGQVDLIRSQISDPLYLTVTRDRMAMIMHKEARKSRGILEIAKTYGIDRDEIVAFGDDDNDVDMLIFAGRGVAMANAIDPVRERADEICDTNDRDGVAKWLDQHILAPHRLQA